MEAEVVYWCARQRHSDSYQGVDGVAVQWHHNQEHTAYAVDDGEEE